MNAFVTSATFQRGVPAWLISIGRTPMGKIWVLDTDTKGTGAEMVPLERALERRRPGPKERVKIVRRRQAAPEAAPDLDDTAPREPSKFRAVSALSGEVLLEDAEARETVAALAGRRSLVDVRIYVREPGGWRPLTIREQKLLWKFRDRVAAAA
jgi:hypothetical protein